MTDEERKEEKRESQKMTLSLLGKYSAIFSFFLAITSALLYYFGLLYYASYVETLGLDIGMFPLDFPGVIMKGVQAALALPTVLVLKVPIVAIFLIVVLLLLGLAINFWKSTFWKCTGITMGVFLLFLWLGVSQLTGSIEANNVLSETSYFIAFKREVSVLYDCENFAKEIKGFIVLSSEQYCAVRMKDSTMVNPQIKVIPRERIQLIKIEHLKSTTGSDSTQTL